MAFFTFVLLTVLTLIGISDPLGMGFLPIGVVFVGIPLIDYIVGTNKKNPSANEEALWSKPIYWGLALYVYSISHFAILYKAALGLSVQSDWKNVLITSVIVGLYTGGLGITVAHELCHKKGFVHQLVADLLLASVCYQHFAVEHVRGHHFRVATFEDPASSRKGESVYAFWLRAVQGGFLHAWQIDSKRVLWGIFLALAFAGSFTLMGIQVLVFFLLQALVAFTLLEFVDYIEHYGLERKKSSSGRYEKVQTYHSWNSSHRFSNWLLFNLQRHSDHHAHANLPYTVLRHHEEAPQLPSGYPGMILLALIPQVWFKVMNEKVDKFNSKPLSE